MTRPARAHLVCGGDFHDFDFARVQLLSLLLERDDVRTTVAGDYRDFPAPDVLVTYTCNVRPTDGEQRVIRSWVEGGGRWLALHATNSALDFTAKGVDSPRVFPLWVDTLGSQFIAHPPIAPYRVEPCADHPLVAGIEPFDTDDELYLSEYHADVEPLLATRWTGTATGFVEAEWQDDEPRIVMYLRPLGAGAVLYNTLGHCRGHHDMRPLMEWYPTIERGSWDVPQYRELLRRGISWCVEGLPVSA